jgi:hypothetical protein
MDPFYAKKILDFDSEDEYERIRRLRSKAVSRPFTKINVSSFCCSNLDLVIVNPWTWRIDRKEGMSYHITSWGLDTIPVYSLGFEGVRCLALSTQAFLYWSTEQCGALRSIGFSGVDVLFIVKELLPHMHGTAESSQLNLIKRNMERCREIWNPTNSLARVLGLDVGDLQCVDTVNDAMKEIARLNDVRVF